MSSDEKEIKITVNDDGPGFPKDIIAKLGEPYIKSKSIELNSNSGLGLGTFLGKTLLERRNAKLFFKEEIKYLKFKLILVLIFSKDNLIR